MVVIMMNLRDLHNVKVNLVDRILDDSARVVDLGNVKETKKFSELSEDSKFDWRYDINGKTICSRNFDRGEVSHFLLFNQDIIYDGTVYVAPAMDARRVA